VPNKRKMIGFYRLKINDLLSIIVFENNIFCKFKYLKTKTPQTLSECGEMKDYYSII